MKQNYTDITIVLDRSGSMNPTRNDTIGGVNRFIEEQRQVPGEATFSLYQFSDNYDPIIKAAPIQDAKLLTLTTYIPEGNTCLYGAIGCAIRETGERIKALPEDQRPEKVIFVIVTDGEENSSPAYEWSKPHTGPSIRADIERQTNTYKWQFVFIGANQDAIGNARNIGVAPANAMKYAANAVGTEGLYKSLSSNVGAMRCGVKLNMSWEKDQVAEQEAAEFKQPLQP